MYIGTYIGGSVNLAAVGRGLEVDLSIWAAANAADVIVFLSILYFYLKQGIEHFL